ncbi:MAG TPA: glycoside hydrolase family 2 TIM barrel-domain containing protein [Gaiellaceae bacterium]|nr:glycoside hydrolase family 2 TIM barrel-domain containing protein [Gaiellaceae bacterium]
MELGDWQIRGCLGEEWRWHLEKPWDAPGWLPARVPGSVLDDLMRAGELPDLYFERNSRAAEWVPERAWIYRTRLEADEPSLLRFEGVDHEATVFLDGAEVAHHVGCFTPFEHDVPPGEHLLCVVVHPAPESEPQVGKTSRVRVHKPRMSYGWDFCPRLVHQGIMSPVTLNEPAPGGPPARPRARLDADYRLDGELVKGWNWVPADALYGVPRPEKVERLLRLAAGSGANLVRVWGGGLLESEQFYDLCDELGLAVWQEFSQSSSGIESVPSADPEFVRTLAEDARRIVPRLARHPSLSVWCGGNELDGDDRTPALAALREVVRELDPERRWLATSPLGADDLHGPWEHQGLRDHNALYDGKPCLLHSEFGVEGMTNRAAHEALIAEEHRWPADRSNPVYEHLGAWWNNAPLVQEAFGGRIADLETLRRASQWLQYDGLRYAVEARLRQGIGVIPWQLNESYPNAWCTAVVDWHGQPKPAYWGVRRAYLGAPSARFATCAWGGEEEVRIAGSGRIVDLHGNEVARGEGELAAPLEAIATDVFLVDLDGRNRYVMSKNENLAPLLDLPAARIQSDKVSQDRQLLRNVGAVAAIGIVCGDVVDLLPGEEREVPAGPYEGWNVQDARA